MAIAYMGPSEVCFVRRVPEDSRAYTFPVAIRFGAVVPECGTSCHSSGAWNFELASRFLEHVYIRDEV